MARFGRSRLAAPHAHRLQDTNKGCRIARSAACCARQKIHVKPDSRRCAREEECARRADAKVVGEPPLPPSRRLAFALSTGSPLACVCRETRA